jgi:hypothetical protein
MKPNPPQIVQERGSAISLRLKSAPLLGTIIPPRNEQRDLVFCGALDIRFNFLADCFIQIRVSFANATVVNIDMHAPFGGGI